VSVVYKLYLWIYWSWKYDGNCLSGWSKPSGCKVINCKRSWY